MVAKIAKKATSKRTRLSYAEVPKGTVADVYYIYIERERKYTPGMV